ncbi:MAG: hypothetical protein V4649_05805 [Bacteroidota bacterium]
MDLKPFTFEQATEICEDFEDLLDTEFRHRDDMVLVEQVVICPYDAAHRHQFISGGNNESPGDTCDVVLVTTTANSSDPIYIPIREYIADNGVSYNFPE